MLKKDRRRGFTLLEMIVVIAIIAVLIALVAPLMTRYITTAKEMKYQAAAKQLCTAGQAYVAEEMLNGYANCVGALDGERYQFNQLTKYGNGIFYSYDVPNGGGVRLESYIDGEVPGDQWMVVIYHFEVKGATIFAGENAYVYPEGFDYLDWMI